VFPRLIPTPSISKVEIGPLTVHFYALCIIVGIAIAVWLGDKRLRRINPALENVVADVAFIAVPVGIIGGRLYHIITSPEYFFGVNGDWVDIFKIWQGGLGIWGAISLGTVGAYFAYRNLSKKSEANFPPFLTFLDALAPGILLAQAVGRFGNWFNAELFGRPLDTWWALSIPVRNRPYGYSEFESFHPTFLYEAILCTAVAALLIFLTPQLKSGQLFLLYIITYSLGRFFIEGIRIDQAHEIAGLRLNQWVSIAIISAGSVSFLRIGKNFR